MTDPVNNPVNDAVIATLQASPVRRWTGTLTLTLLGALLIYLGFTGPFGLSQFFLIGGGVIALLGANFLHSSTKQVIELTNTELRIKGSEVLTSVANIARVDRGAFAFKPSNGFSIFLKTPTTRRWGLGLFWCFSKRIGIGGVTSAPEARMMAERLITLLD